ncbi:MAG TPA: ribosomal protein S18-alanine N-acetyltransferase [Gemmatimonadaceae bacterium]|nr:ribosomal protein S18-alanine N-acetyltransferase [Gemmatimonadaceae bacterium]
MAATVRLAEARDLPSILAIERQSFSDPWTADAFESAFALQRMRMFVAEAGAAGGRGGAPVLAGYVVALLLGAEAEIADLAVAPSARRRGIGRLLLDRVVADLASRGVMEVFLEVRDSNSAARTLYETRGFETVGRRRGYYRHPVEDALILKRQTAPG